MKTIETHINGRYYTLACGEGEEERLRRLGQTIDRRMQDIKTKAPGIQEQMLWVMVALMMADELQDARQTNQMLKHYLEAQAIPMPEGVPGFGLPGGMISEDELVQVLDGISSRIEALAVQVERG